jgi:hypothetical protein
MKLRVPQNARNFFSSSETTSFSPRTPLHRVSSTLVTHVRHSDLKKVPDFRGFGIGSHLTILSSLHFTMCDHHHHINTKQTMQISCPK